MKKNLLINEIINKIKKVTGNSKASLHEPVFWGKEKEYLCKCIDSSYVAVGDFVELFENKVKKYTNSNYVIATNSGTSALHISYLVAGVKQNDEVLIPTLNFVASSNAALYLDAIPHFVDVEEKTLGLDPEKLYNYLCKISLKRGKNFLNKKTKRRIKAIVPTHTFGHAADINGILKVSKIFNLNLIEDASESIGSFYKNKHLGTFGKFGVLSFNGNKTITTGAGGALLLQNKSDYIKAKKLINVSKLPHNWELIYDGLGYNYKMSNLQAALGCAQFQNLEKIISKKHKLLNTYIKAFKKNPYAKIFENKYQKRPNYWLQTLVLNNNILNIKNTLLSKANSKNIMLRPVWKLMHKLPHLYKYPKMDLSTSSKLEKKLINLPSSIYI